MAVSGRFSIIVAEQASQSLSPLHRALARIGVGEVRAEKAVAHALMVPFDKLKSLSEGVLAEANQKLENAAKQNGGRPDPPKPPKQPPVRRPPPPGLRRVENRIAVPEDERKCPTCGTNRRCITHETTEVEVIDLIPAEVIVRLDIREVLGCEYQGIGLRCL